MHESPSEQSAVGIKICIYCGEDCSDRPRVRDKQNRYACRDCATKASKEWEHQGPLTEEVDPDIVFALEPELKAEVVRVDCPVCLREIRAGESMCVSCQYDPAVGLTEETQIGRKPLGPEGLICVKCNYNLRGLKAMRCPECGEHIRPRSSSEKKAGRFRDEATREAYRTPLLMIGIAGGAYLLWIAALSGPLAVPLALLGLGFQVVTGVVAFFLCSLVVFGFDTPWHLTILRLTGIYAVVNLASLAITELLGVSIIFRFLLLLVFIQMLSSLLELDLVDAVILGFVLFILRTGLIVMLVMWGMGAF